MRLITHHDDEDVKTRLPRRLPQLRLSGNERPPYSFSAPSPKAMGACSSRALMPVVGVSALPHGKHSDGAAAQRGGPNTASKVSDLDQMNAADEAVAWDLAARAIRGALDQMGTHRDETLHGAAASSAAAHEKAAASTIPEATEVLHVCYSPSFEDAVSRVAEEAADARTPHRETPAPSDGAPIVEQTTSRAAAAAAQQMEMEVYGPEHEGWGIRGWLHHIFRKEELQARPESRPDSREQAAVRMQRLWRGRRARRQLIEVRRQRKRQSALKKRPNLMDSRLAQKEKDREAQTPQANAPVRASLSFAAPTKGPSSPVRPALSFPAACPTSAREEQEPTATGAKPVESNDDSAANEDDHRVKKRPSFQKRLASRLSFKRLASRLSFRRPGSFPLTSRAAKQRAARKAEAAAAAAAIKQGREKSPEREQR